MPRVHHRFPPRVALLRPAAMLAVGLSVLGIAAGAAELRTWSDASGQFSIQARYVSADASRVTLEQEDGSELEIELKKLSPADQKYVGDQVKAAANPFTKKAPSNPFKTRAAPSASAPATGVMRKARPPAPADDEGGDSPQVRTPQWAGARAVAVAPGGEWSFKPPAPEASAAYDARKARAVALPPKANFFEKVNGLAVNAASRRAVVGNVLDEPKPAGTTRLVLCDLETGSTLGAGTAAGKLAPAALSDDGARVLMRRDEWGWGNSDRLEIWGLSGSGIRKELAWVPYGDLTGGDRDVKWADFVGDDRVATISGSGKLAVWDLGTLKPVYYLQAQGGSVPGLSPDRRLIAFHTGKEVGILDVEGARVVASVAAPQGHAPTLIFSPGGTRLACAGIDRLLVWDFATGKLYREVPYLGAPVHGPSIWATEDHVLLGGHTLVDLATQVKLWAYNGGEAVRSLGGLCWFVVMAGEQSPGALVPLAIPHVGVREKLRQAMADPTFFVLKPGVTVKVDASALPDASARETARQAMETKLRAMGCNVGPAGTIDLVAATEPGKKADISYHFFGRPGARTVSFQQYISKVKFVYQGKTAWEAGGNNIPGIVQLKEGQTLEDFLRQAEKPNYAFFGFVELPKLLTRPTGQPTLGASQVTTAGLR